MDLKKKANPNSPSNIRIVAIIIIDFIILKVNQYFEFPVNIYE